MFKRDLKLFFCSLVSSCGLLVLLILICTLILAVIMQSVGEAYIPVKVAIVDNEDSVLSRILVRAVGQTEQISSLLEPVNMGEDDAKAAFERGECEAIVVLPEDFTEDILHLREAAGTIILSRNLGSQISVVTAVADFGELLLASGQYAIYCGEEVLYDYGAGSATFSDFYESANAALLTEASEANQKYFTHESLGYMSTGLNTESYFILYWAVAILFLVSLFFSPLFFTDCTHALLSRLYTLGIGSVAFIRWKLILLWGFRALILTLAALLLLADVIVAPWLYTALAIVFAALYITLVGTCLTLCFGNPISANVIFSVLGLFLCGAIVPRQLLPDVVTKIGDLTPFGVAGSILAPAFGGPVDIFALTAALIYATIAFAMLISHLDGTRVGKGDANI